MMYDFSLFESGRVLGVMIQHMIDFGEHVLCTAKKSFSAVNQDDSHVRGVRAFLVLPFY